MQNVRIDLYKGGSFLRTMAASVPAANGVFTAYTISNTHPVGGDFRVRVSAVENPAVYDESNNDFSISSASSDTSMALVAQAGPSSITLNWSSYANPDIQNRDVSRRVMTAGGGGWDSLLTLGPTTVSHTDSVVTPGTIYEYRVRRTLYAEGFIAAGIDVPLTDSRGTVLLLVDETMAAPLAVELANHQRDLVGDGWKVVRHDVPRKVVDESGWKEAVAATKAIVLATATAHPDLRTVSIFGHVPVPYSGDAAPDGHNDHKGAWPADGYYGELNRTWTDSSVNRSTATFTRNRNVPGDGKFDPTYFPSAVDLEVGRVDFRDMPAFSQGEIALLRQYLEKNRRFRFGQTAVVPRALVDENFGEAFAYAGYRAGSLFGGDSKVDRADWFTTLGSQNYLIAYGNGGGNYPSVAGVGTTTDFATKPSGGVFTALFGSYFGDWDNQNNVLRAAIAGSGGLTCVWSARPHWFFHPMGMGETVGYSARLSMNTESAYSYFAFGQQGVHMALLGDPTLRLHVVSPPSSLQVAGTTSKVLQWTPSPDPGVMGYHVYRAPQALGPYTRLSGVVANAANPSGAPVTTNTFTDPAPVSGGVYMVRAVKNETGFVPGAGNYFNQSQGIFSDEGENTRVWDGGGSDNSWSTAENWTLDAAPTAGNVLAFGGIAQLSPHNDFSSGTAIAGICFNLTAGAFTLSGNALTLAGNVVNESASLQTVSLAMTLGADRRFEANAGPITVGGALSSSGGVIKSGAHALTLSGSLTYTGRTAIEAGTLRLVSPLTTSGGLQMSGTGTLDLNGNNATFTSSAATGGHIGATGNTITDTGAGTGTSLITINNNASQGAGLGALITDGPTRKIGVSIINNAHWQHLLLNSNNTFSGGILVSGGSGLGSRMWLSQYTGTTVNGTLTQSELGTGTVTIGQDAAKKGQIGLNLAGRTIHNDITYNTRLGIDLAGGIRLQTGGAANTLAGRQTANLANFAITGNGGTQLIVTGKITGNQGLEMLSVGNAVTLTLNGAVGANDYAGDTLILRANTGTDISTLQLGANDQIPDGAGRGNVNAVGRLRLNGFNETINGLRNVGDPSQPAVSNPALSVVENGSATTASTLTLGAGNATAAFSGTITNGGSAALHLVKTGTGTQTLSGPLTYTGRTAVEAGMLRLGSPLLNSAALQMSGTGILDLNGNNATFTSTSNPGSTTSAASIITDNAAGSGTSTVRFVDGAANGTSDGAITDGATRKVAVEISNVQGYVQRLRNNNSTYSGGTVIANNASGSRFQIGSYNPTFVAGTLTKSEVGTGAIIIGQSATDKASMYFDTGTANKTFYNAITYNTSTGLDANWKGVAFNVAGITLAGTQTANLADATYVTFTYPSQTAAITGRITGNQGLSVGPLAYVMNLTLANAAGTTDYAGDTKIGQSGILILGAANQLPDGTGKGNVNVLRTLRLNGFSDTINGLTGSGTVHNNHASTASTLTLGAGDATASFTGVLADGSTAALSLTKIGSGTQTLTGPQTYTGATAVEGGTLALGATGALASPNVTVSAGATLALQSGATLSSDTRLQLGGKIDLNGNTTVRQFWLNGELTFPGEWGSTASGANHVSDTYFSGSGVLTVLEGFVGTIEIVR